MFCEKTKRIQYLHRYLHINKYRYWIANVLVGFIYDLLGTVVDQNKIGQSKFRLCNSIFLRNPSLRKQKCQK
jgi:hypothetical protein